MIRCQYKSYKTGQLKMTDDSKNIFALIQDIKFCSNCAESNMFLFRMFTKQMTGIP